MANRLHTLAQTIAHKYTHKIGLWSASACYSRSSRASLWLHFSKVLYTQRINLKEPKKWLNKCRFISLYWHIFIKTGSSQHIKWLGGRKILIISLHARSNVKFLCMPNTCRIQPKPYAWDTQPAWRWWSGFVAWLLFFWQELCTSMTCRFAFGNISRTPSLLHNERFLKCRLTVLLIVEGTGERCQSGTRARQRDCSGFWLKVSSVLRLYFACILSPLRSHALIQILLCNV